MVRLKTISKATTTPCLPGNRLSQAYKTTLYATLIIPSLQNPFYSELAQSINQTGISAGYQVDIKVSQGNPKIEEGLVRYITESQYYGNLLYAGLNSTNPALSQSQASGESILFFWMS